MPKQLAYAAVAAILTKGAFGDLLTAFEDEGLECKAAGACYDPGAMVLPIWGDRGGRWTV
jgi:hypothetical protein